MSEQDSRKIKLEKRLKTIKHYHIMGDADKLSKAFVEKAINDALEIVELHDMVKLV